MCVPVTIPGREGLSQGWVNDHYFFIWHLEFRSEDQTVTILEKNLILEFYSGDAIYGYREFACSHLASALFRFDWFIHIALIVARENLRPELGHSLGMAILACASKIYATSVILTFSILARSTVTGHAGCTIRGRFRPRRCRRSDGSNRSILPPPPGA